MIEKNRFDAMIKGFNRDYTELKGLLENHQFQNVTGTVQVHRDRYEWVGLANNGWGIASITADGFNSDLDSLTAREVLLIARLMEVMQTLQALNNLGK